MKNKKGVTLISLIVTIMVLAILSSVAIYTGRDIIESSKLTTFTAEMKVMQTEVNAIYEKYINGESINANNTSYEGDEILGLESTTTSEITTRKNEIFQALNSDLNAGIYSTEKDQYKYWNNDLIKKLGIEGVENAYFVNVKRRSIISYNGLNYEGKMYYTLAQLPDSFYNVEYEDKNGVPTFDVNVNQQSKDKWKIDISNIQYNEGYIEKWQVQYKLDSQEYWSTSDDLSFVVNKAGNYIIKIKNGNIESEEQTVEITVSVTGGGSQIPTSTAREYKYILY